MGFVPEGGYGALRSLITIRTGGHRERRTGLPRGEGERAIRDIAIVEVGYGGGGGWGGKVTEQGRLITERVSAKHENEEKNDGSKAR